MSRTAEERSKSRGDALRGMRILLVEDDHAILRILSIILEKFGGSVTKAVNGDIAVDILSRTTAFNAVITDEQMPGETQGHDLIEHIKATSPRTPVILMSGFAAGTSYEITEAGAGVVSIMKPIRSDELVKVLVDILGSQSGQD